MERILKPFVASVTDFRHNLFVVARLKLTALYVLIVALIVCGFSIFLFTSILHNLQDASEDDFATPSSRIHFIEHTREPIRNTLVATDAFIILAAAGLSYLLAGVTLRPVQRSLEAQQLFAAQASHELRTPLTVMQNEAEVILRNKSASPLQLRETLQSAVEEVQNMSQLVENLLILARSENTRSMRNEEVSVSELLEHVLSKMQPLASKKGIRLVRNGTPAAHLRGDQEALSRVFFNTLQNAIEHTDTRGSISITSKLDSHSVIFSIQDTGRGIPSDQLPHVFERFYKGTPREGRVGSGLGLSIVQEIVNQHKGEISIQSETNMGTTVHISFPVA